jgi:hypothetical protein
MSVFVVLDCECVDSTTNQIVVLSLITQFSSDRSFNTAADNLFDYLLGPLNNAIAEKYGSQYYIDDSVEAARFLNETNVVDLVISD